MFVVGPRLGQSDAEESGSWMVSSFLFRPDFRPEYFRMVHFVSARKTSENQGTPVDEEQDLANVQRDEDSACSVGAWRWR